MSAYRPYPKYRDSGVAWLGEVPEAWLVKKLCHISWMRARLGWKGLKADEYVESGYGFLSTPNIKGDEIDFSRVNFITEERYLESPEIMLSEGDILLAKDGSTLGTVNVIRKLPIKATVNSSIAVITPAKSVSSLYLYYQFVGSFFQQTIQLLKGGMGVPHLYQEDLNKVHFLLPSVKEQHTIGIFLDRETGKIDLLIREQKELIALLQEKRQALISNAVTKGLDPKAKMKDSGVEWLGEVPEHWAFKRLRRLCEITTGGKDTENRVDDGEYPFFVRSQEVERIDSFSFDGEGILTAGDGVGVAKVFHYYTGKFDFHQRVYLLFNFKNEITGAFLFEYIREHFHKEVLKLSAKSTVDSLRMPMFQEFPVLVPPIHEQSAIVKYLEKAVGKIDLLIKEAEETIDLMHEHRASLISEAVTGKIDVRGLL